MLLRTWTVSVIMINVNPECTMWGLVSVQCAWELVSVNAVLIDVRTLN